MAELPLFPLPETVVFPGMTLPLWLFEDRYRKMVRDCLESNQRHFVIVLAREGADISDAGPATYEVGAFVDILSVTENPDGTYNMLVHGQERCFVKNIDEKSHPYYSIDPYPYPLERGDPNEERVAAWDALELFNTYARTFFSADAAQQVDEALPEDLVYQASFVCANLRVSALSRQLMLEAPSLTGRFRTARRLMNELLDARPAS